MTGEELYELSANGYKHEPWDDLPKLIKDYYDAAARNRHRMLDPEQGESIHSTERTCCGGCSGHCD